MSGMLGGKAGGDLTGAQRFPQAGIDGSSSTANSPESKAAALVDAETARTEKERIAAIQRQLMQETTFRNRGYGLRALFGALGGGRTTLLGTG